MKYSWTVVINKLPYGIKAAHPWTAVSRALQVYCKEHPQSSRILFDIYVVNRTLADQGKAVEETFNRHRKELLAELPEFQVHRDEDGKGEQAGDKNAKERS